ncbi:hypothetical protein GCM10022402_02940 [Salinactinospora qingdaonensis]|uniref:Uncharacterized protein n=1 Tax=Salinactinospora qingdaonensis TaxID=702744 RepID=A0ABP7EVD3_9ACTN
MGDIDHGRGSFTWYGVLVGSAVFAGGGGAGDTDCAGQERENGDKGGKGTESGEHGTPNEWLH